jgi:cytochrome c biogenesis protein CcdA
MSDDPRCDNRVRLPAVLSGVIMMFGALFALLAGIVTIAAPCTLPILPILLGASVGQNSRARPVFVTLGFVTAFSFVALALNAITRSFDFDPDDLRLGAITALLLFGLLLVWPAPFEWLSAQVSGLASRRRGARLSNHRGNLGGFVLGTTLGLVWTPCAGPVLGSILTVIATAKDTAWSSILLIIYAVGAGIPMLAIAYGGQAVTTRLRPVARFAPRLQQCFGLVVVALGLAMYFQYDALLLARLGSLYPNGRLGL